MLPAVCPALHQTITVGCRSGICLGVVVVIVEMEFEGSDSAYDLLHQTASTGTFPGEVYALHSAVLFPLVGCKPVLGHKLQWVQ